MACSAYISYQLGSHLDSLATTTTIQVTARPVPRTVRPSSSRDSLADKASATTTTTKTTATSTSTSFVLVDPSTSNAHCNGSDARKSIRKHASKACAAQRLATIAAKKKSGNVLTKRERQRRQAAERLEAALQLHAQKLAASDVSTTSVTDVVATITTADVTIGPAAKTAYLTTTTDTTTTTATANDPSPLSQKNDMPPPVSAGRDSRATYQTPSPELASGPPSRRVSAGSDRKGSGAGVSWVLTPPPSSTTSAEDKKDAVLETHVIKDEHVTPTSIVGVQSARLDPFSSWPVDVRDDGTLASCLSFLDRDIYPLMDLRLPAKYDKIAGTRHAHSQQLPQFVISSEPLFWTMALSAATIFTMHKRQRPGAEPLTMGYRYMAIRSVNQRLAALGENSIFDIGLIYAIASLGVWEREKGTREVWLSHCQGIDMLSTRLKQASQHHLLEYIVGCCRTEGSVPITFHPGEGFKRNIDTNSLDPNLISGIYECAQLDKPPTTTATETPTAEDRTARAALIAQAATRILSYRVSDAVPKTLCSNRVRGIAGDRQNLEMHVLLQGAGLSLISHVGGPAAAPFVEPFDVDEMCREAVDLATSVAEDPDYNELLLWATLNIFALNRYVDSRARNLVRMLAQRLGFAEWTQLESSMRLFVYLNSADALYREYWDGVGVVPRRASAPAATSTSGAGVAQVVVA